MNKPPLHIAYLDAVRGLAALSVVNEHYVIAYGLPCQSALCSDVLDYSPLHIWWDGTAAVSMFFVLSGLVLSYKYVRDDAEVDMKHYSLMTYVVSRLCRIGLPYLVVLALSAALYEMLHDAPVMLTRLASDTWINQMWRGHLLTHWAMLKEAFLLRLPAEIILIPQAWTLSIELVLSLFLPLALLLLQRSWGWLVFFTVLAVMFANVSLFAVHFALGILIAKYGIRASAFLVQQRRVRCWLWVLGFLLYTSADSLYKVLDNTGLWLATGAGAGLLLLSVLASKRAQIVLSKGWLRYLGKVSYSVYLLHMLVLMWVTPWLLSLLDAININRLSLWFLGWFATVFVSLSIAHLSYRYLEMTSMYLGRCFRYSVHNAKAN